MPAPHARTVVIPVRPYSYGVVPLDPVLWWPEARPDNRLDYSVDCTTALTEVEDRIAFASLRIAPSGKGEMIASDISADGFVLTVWLEGGVPGRRYSVKLNVRTRNRRNFDWIIGINVDLGAARWPLRAPPSNGFGSPLIYKEVSMLCMFTVVATGNSQLTAAPVPLGNILVNAGAGGGICLPAATKFDDETMTIYNRSGGPITIYPHGGDTIEDTASNSGVVIQNDQTVHFAISNSGLLILS